MYLALALSFAHVLALGPSFVGHPLTQIVWSVAWAATAGLVLCYRFGLPVVRSLRHRLVVAEVRAGGAGRGVGHLHWAPPGPAGRSPAGSSSSGGS